MKPIIDKFYSFADNITANNYLATGRAKGEIAIKII